MPEEEKTTGKHSRKSREPGVAHDLLVENLGLCKKQEHALQKASQRIWSCESM